MECISHLQRTTTKQNLLSPFFPISVSYRSGGLTLVALPAADGVTSELAEAGAKPANA
jgi:hypothetical protein